MLYLSKNLDFEMFNNSNTLKFQKLYKFLTFLMFFKTLIFCCFTPSVYLNKDVQKG